MVLLEAIYQANWYLKNVKANIAELIDIRMKACCLKLYLRRLERVVQRETQGKFVR